jgi:hypothetical protein
VRQFRAPLNQGAGERSFPLGDSLNRGCRDERVPRGRDLGGGQEGNGWLFFCARSFGRAFFSSRFLFNWLPHSNFRTHAQRIFAAHLPLFQLVTEQ